eukprot:TRINITY_DN52296_c0_g1_i1.p1 TRINITY_DN52296_c0_g1~~TRINITY_DN52296_c0_g1_i1.p1  ORF type:complete len:1325 (+),score=135.67 TRINITY_DN52296_c0_g1_i1:405-3977(+)
MTAGTVGGTIYVFGGDSPGRVWNDLWSINLDESLPRWQTLCPHASFQPTATCNGGSMPVPTTNMGMVTVNDNLYVFGGRITTGSGKTSSLWVWNTATTVWSEICTNLVFCNGGLAPAARDGMAISVIGTTIYVFGGSDTAGNRLNDLWTINTASALPQWTCYSSSSGCLNPAQNEPTGGGRQNHAWAPLNGQLYMFGGNLAGNLYRNDLYRLSLTTNPFWTPLCSSDDVAPFQCGFNGPVMPPPRAGQSIAAFEGSGAFILFGGEDSGSYYNDLWFYPIARSGVSCDFDVSKEYCPDTSLCVDNNRCDLCRAGTVEDPNSHVCAVLDGAACQLRGGQEYCASDNTCKLPGDCSSCPGFPIALAASDTCLGCSAVDQDFCATTNQCLDSCVGCPGFPIVDPFNRICTTCSVSEWACSSINICVTAGDCSSCTGLPIPNFIENRCDPCGTGSVLCRDDNTCKPSGTCSSCLNYPREDLINRECTVCSPGTPLCEQTNTCQGFTDCSNCPGHGAFSILFNKCLESSRDNCQADAGKHYCDYDESCQPRNDCSGCRFSPEIDQFRTICIPGSPTFCHVSSSREFCDVDFACKPDRDCSSCPGQLSVDDGAHTCVLSGPFVELMWTSPGQFEGNINRNLVEVRWRFAEPIKKGRGSLFWSDGTDEFEVGISSASLRIQNGDRELVWRASGLPADSAIEVRFSQNDLVETLAGSRPSNLHTLKHSLIFSTASPVESTLSSGIVLNMDIDDFVERKFQEAISLGMPTNLRPSPDMVRIIEATWSTGVTFQIERIATGNAVDIFTTLSLAILGASTLNARFADRDLGSIVDGTVVSSSIQSAMFQEVVITNAPDKCGGQTSVTIELTTARTSFSNVGILRSGRLAISFPLEWELESDPGTFVIEVEAPDQAQTRTYTGNRISKIANTLIINMGASPLSRNVEDDETFIIRVTNGLTMPPTCEFMNGWVWVVRSLGPGGDATTYNWAVANPRTDTCKGNSVFVFGDPHFISFSGGQYDITGSAGHHYNIISDRYFNWNAKFVNRHNTGEEMTYLGVSGFLINGTHVVCDPATRTLTIENKEVKVSNERVPLQPGSPYYVKVADEGLMFLRVPGYRLVLKPIHKAHGYPLPHFDHWIEPMEETDGSGKIHPHGLLGQTANFNHPVKPKNKNGLGVIEGTVKEYEVRSLFSLDFKFAQYGK